MPAFHRSSIREFIASSDSELTGLLSIAYAKEGFEKQRTDQTAAWASDLFLLRGAMEAVCAGLPEALSWTLLLEFNIPRKMRRIDCVVLAGDHIVLLECKTHAPTNEDRLQAEEYALLLHYFHQPSDKRRIIPLVVSSHETSRSRSPQREMQFLETAAYWIEHVQQVSWTSLPDYLISQPIDYQHAIDPDRWEAGAYRPVPTIIDAALALRSGLEIHEIAHSGAARHDVDELTAFVREIVAAARRDQRHVICFLTGVPGSGKTLVGLNMAFSKQHASEPIHFMSGNGPLVKVLQVVLTRHRMREGARALDAKIEARTFIENVHIFARNYAENDKDSAPAEHVVIFDEAQRAWDRAQNKAKFGRDYSEPEMLLKIMERHEDWAVVIALVGGGQEINSGEAGLEEWGRTLTQATSRKWQVIASPEAIDGGTSVAGSRLSNDSAISLDVQRETKLHLSVSVRSLKAESYAAWVNAVIDGDVVVAMNTRQTLEFPILVTRDLNELRAFLRGQLRGLSRAGLAGSSQAIRLRADGLEPDSTFHGSYPWEHWYLAGREDVRSSHQLEVFATEFEIQGLELDWIGLCWGGDMVWSESRSEWSIRAFRPSSAKWSEVKPITKRTFRRNAYRVLLTRARQGIVLYIPKGRSDDITINPKEFDATAQFLIRCGATPLGQATTGPSEMTPSLWTN